MSKREEKRLNGKSAGIFLRDCIVAVAGTVVYSAGVQIFTAPQHIAPGGITGIATLINYLTGFPIGTGYLIMNIPILVLGFIFIGKSFMTRTFVTAISFTLVMDFLMPLVPSYPGDALIAAIFGGVFMGAGLAIVFSTGGSTAGMDIINKIVQKKFPFLPLGRIIFISDLAVILLSLAVYRNIEVSLYAVVAMYISSVVINNVIYGAGSGKLIIIISREYEAVRSGIIEKIERGCTLLHSRGGFGEDDGRVIMCAVRKTEVHKVTKMVSQLDSEAFVVVSEANEIFGNGFMKKTL